MIEALYNLDLIVTKFFASGAFSPLLDKAMVFLTSLGDAGIIWILCGLLLLPFKKTRTMGVALLLSLAFSFLVSQIIIKPLVNRSRPYLVVEGVELLTKIPRGSSFPSSHATTSFASAMSIFCFSKKYGTVALVLAALLSFTRIYLCVHFLSDVVAGIFLGAALGFLLTRTLFFQARN